MGPLHPRRSYCPINLLPLHKCSAASKLMLLHFLDRGPLDILTSLYP